jgi:hypothetical protein
MKKNSLLKEEFDSKSPVHHFATKGSFLKFIEEVDPMDDFKPEKRQINWAPRERTDPITGVKFTAYHPAQIYAPSDAEEKNSQGTLFDERETDETTQDNTNNQNGELPDNNVDDEVSSINEEKEESIKNIKAKATPKSKTTKSATSSKAKDTKEKEKPKSKTTKSTTSSKAKDTKEKEKPKSKTTKSTKNKDTLNDTKTKKSNAS